MRSKIIYALVTVLLVATWAARAGNEADARFRSRCTAIGLELRRKVADKRSDVERFRAVTPDVVRNWDDYLKRADALAISLVDTFAGPQPTRGADRATAASLGLEALTHTGKACTVGSG